MLRVKCPSGHIMAVKDKHIGRKVKCPQCFIAMRVKPPREPDELSEGPGQIWLCPAGHHFKVLAEHSGKAVRCPRCAQPVRVPKFESTDVAAVESDPPVDHLSEEMGAANPYAASDSEGVVHSAAKPVMLDAPREKVWPIAVLLGTALATLIGIAVYLRMTGVE